MMDYEYFYTIAEYGNENWKGSFSPKEVACNTYNYLCEFNFSFATETATETIKSLYELLVEDGSEQCLEWAYDIAKELHLIDMDFMDYMETDTALIKHILERK